MADPEYKPTLPRPKAGPFISDWQRIDGIPNIPRSREQSEEEEKEATEKRNRKKTKQKKKGSRFQPKRKELKSSLRIRTGALLTPKITGKILFYLRFCHCHHHGHCWPSKMTSRLKLNPSEQQRQQWETMDSVLDL